MSREDLQLSAFYRQRIRKTREWSSMNLTGGAWDDLLDGAVASGRLYFGEELRSYNPPQGHRVLSEEPPEVFEATWETDANGDSKPVVRAGKQGLIIIPISPPRYIDAAEGIIGRVESKFPGSVLLAWNKGPVVPPAHLSGLM